MSRLSAQGITPATSSAASAALALTPLEVVAKNSPEGNGKRPFHVMMSFQIYDLQGKASEQGTIDYWWAGAAGSRLAIKAPSFGTVASGSLEGLPNAEARRTWYLANELLQAFRDPGAQLRNPGARVVTEQQVIRSTPFNCMYAMLPNGRRGDAVCSDPQTGTIRTITAPGAAVLRNHVGSFGDTRVSLDLVLFRGGIEAVTGKVETLKDFDPSSEKEELAPVTRTPEHDQAGEAPGVITGEAPVPQKTGGSNPEYPAPARIARVSGSVNIGLEVMETGKVANLFVIESSSNLLTQAALDAVSTWTYKPFLVNGQPVRFSTDVTVNFNPNNGGQR